MPEENTQTSESGGGKKWLWIILGVIAVVIIGGLFTGAFGRGSGLGSAYFAPGVDVDANMDGSTTYTSEDGSGTVTVGGGSMPENWPSDLPTAYSGATIIYAGTTNPATGEAGSAVSYTVSATAESVAEYYNSRLQAEGWAIVSNSQVNGMNVIAATKDTRTFGVYIAPSEGGATSVTAGVQL